ncbi:MAG: selenium cofactor biosynthesis protein YqeC [Gammaproteobacteria bacterium]
MRRPESEGLLDLLEARRGLVCMVGAGGKKTILYRLAAEHPGRVAVSATSHVEHFPKWLSAVVIAPEAELLEQVRDALSRNTIVAFAQPSAKAGRFAGLSGAALEEIVLHAGFDVCFVKADGARNRLLKAPDEHEPPIPTGTHTVIPVLSAKALGLPVSDRVVHRLEHFTAVTGARPGQAITPSHLARLLSAEHGALQNVGNAHVVPVITMAGGERTAPAREAAQKALTLTARFDRVVLAEMRDERAVVEVVRRPG